VRGIESSSDVWREPHIMNTRFFVSLSVYVVLTNIPEGELLTGFAMRSDRAIRTWVVAFG